MEEGFSRKRAIIKRILYGLLLFFLIFFIVGFFNVGGKVLLGTLIPFVLLSLFLLFVIPGLETLALKNYLWLTAIAAIVFSGGVAYGILGIWGFFEVDNRIYLGTVMIAWAGFLLGLIESFIHLKKLKRKERFSNTK
ncbi:MAG: hypothetical protein HKN89_02545 [Eudoraea sp.]|nr:hypothetical protein [Eudoraea sp.]